MNMELEHNYNATDVHTKEQKRIDELDFVDEEYNAIAKETHNNLVHPLVEAGGEVRELRELLTRVYEQLCLLGYDSCFTNDEINKLTNDILKYFGGIE
jgi:hypothetical protein